MEGKVYANTSVKSSLASIYTEPVEVLEEELKPIQLSH